MLRKTDITVNISLIDKLLSNLPDVDFRISLNQPTGNFFYDPWIIKPEFKFTVIDKILSLLPTHIGEARIIRLKPGNCYTSHSDIDNRYHLNLSSNKSYLINLDNEEMFLLEKDGYWYDMDASPRHTATNFGQGDRLQLVVRHLLIHNNLKDPIPVKIISSYANPEDTRFFFDDSISLWLNKANIRGIIDNFSPKKDSVDFIIEKKAMEELIDYLPDNFKLVVRY